MVWSRQPGIEQGLSALGVSARDIGTAVTELRGDLLAGGDQMHALYRACWSVVRAAHSAQEVVAGFRASSVPVYDSFIKLGTQNVDGEIGRAEWEWNRVGRAYNVLAAALETLNSEAQEVVGDELQELRGFTIEGPGQLPGFPDPSHMYYM